MKKLIALGALLYLCVGVSAHAQVSISLGLGNPQPSYIEQPAPAYAVVPSYPAYYNYGYYDNYHNWHRGRRPGPRHFDRDHGHGDGHRR